MLGQPLGDKWGSAFYSGVFFQPIQHVASGLDGITGQKGRHQRTLDTDGRRHGPVGGVGAALPVSPHPGTLQIMRL